MRITEFQGVYRFLSNFYPAPVTYDGQLYPTVEHAYQAAKTLDINERDKIANARTAGDAKRIGRKVRLRSDWEQIKLSVMEQLLREKFKGNMAYRLSKTYPYELVEGNHWRDYYWGVCNGKGENRLGKLLMQIRSDLCIPIDE